MNDHVTSQDVCRAIRLLLITSEMQQKALAVDAGLTQTKLSAILSGKRILMLDDYFRICAALNVDPSKLIRIAMNYRRDTCDLYTE